MKSFDYAAFKAGWLAGCEKYHIDPATGPTSFTICNLTADANKAAKIEQAALLTLAEVSDVLESWLALGRWGWGVDLVEWGLISSLLVTAIRLTKPKEAPVVPMQPPEIIDEGWGLGINFWVEVKREFLGDEALTPYQRELLRESLPTWDEIRPRPIAHDLVLAS